MNQSKCGTYVSKIIIEYRCATLGHSHCIFIGWTNEKVITDCLANLILILEAIINAFPVGVLQRRATYRAEMGKEKKTSRNITLIYYSLCIISHLAMGQCCSFLAIYESRLFETFRLMTYNLLDIEQPLFITFLFAAPLVRT